VQKQAILVLFLLVLAGLGGVLTMPSTSRELPPSRPVQVADSKWANLVTYIANEGVLLDFGSKKIVIDGMFRHLPGYPRPSDTARNEMENALGKFAEVDLVLATHHHADHFDAKVVGWHLTANRKATFVAARQATQDLAEKFPGYPQFASRVLEVTPGTGQSIELQAGGVPLRVLRLRHGNTMNVGFLLDMGLFKVLHVGDADGDVANFDPFDLQKEEIDYALLPYWYALDAESRRVIREHIAPKQVIFFHIPEDDPDHPQLQKHMQELGGRAGLTARIQKEFPQAMFLLTPGTPAASYSR
jgi:L-ascorbate metabolism protein UlaG (beta-lactamase superfamily)